MRIIILLVVFGYVAAQAGDAPAEAEVRRIPTHNPEWTNAREGDPGVTESVVPELQSIVVLCATQPNSAEFRRQWRQWLQSHYRQGMDIDATIADVLRRADEHRVASGHKARSAKGKKKISRSMHRSAKSIINNMKA